MLGLSSSYHRVGGWGVGRYYMALGVVSGVARFGPYRHPVTTSAARHVGHFRPLVCVRIVALHCRQKFLSVVTTCGKDRSNTSANSSLKTRNRILRILDYKVKMAAAILHSPRA